jgi:hypothetical protein
MSDDLLPINKRTGEVNDIPLVDDLADVLSRVVVGWKNLLGDDLSEYPDVRRVMARYRRDTENER